MAIVTCPGCATSLDVPEEFVGRMVRCSTCDRTFEATLSAPVRSPLPASSVTSSPLPPEQPAPSYQPTEHDYRGPRRDLEPHRGVLIMVLGIISTVMAAIACPGSLLCGVCSVLSLVGLGLGIPAWVMGHSDLKRMDQGQMDPDGRSQTKAGYICGIIGTILPIITVVVAIVFFVLLMVTSAAGNKGRF